MVGRTVAPRVRPLSVPPGLVGGSTALGAALFALLRWWGPARRNWSSFALVSHTGLVHHPPRGIREHRHGYDGQFYLRLALDPWRPQGLVRGLHVDSALRAQRIGYPALAWGLSGGGRIAVLPFVLVAVNVLAYGALALLGALLAQRFGASPAFGWAFVAFPGFVVTLARDTTELMASALVLAAVLALSARRWIWCTVALTAAVLTRETALVLVAGVLVWRVALLLRGRVRPGTPDLAWLVPATAFGAWQVVSRARFGVYPMLADRTNTSGSAWSLLPSAGRAVEHLPGSLVYLGSLVAVILVAVTAAAGMTGSTRRLGSALPDGAGAGAGAVVAPVWVAFGIATLLAASLSVRVWNGDAAEVRVGADVVTLGLAVLLTTRPRWISGYAVVGGTMTACAAVLFAHRL